MILAFPHYSPGDVCPIVEEESKPLGNQDKTMKNRILALMLSITAAVGTSACIGYERESSLTGPSAISTNALLGSWSAANIIPSPNTCTDFVWNVSEQTAISAKGAFSATCAGDLKVSGTAEGAFTSSGAIGWSAKGNATAPGLTSCAITLTGTAELTTSSIRIPYNGTTCLGTVQGTQVLTRN
jgi:hypothetical protein